jgi:hypothetical protein
MVDSDEDYVGAISEEEEEGEAHVVSAGAGTRARRRKQHGGAEWEVSRTWESVVEGADGTISSTVEGLLEAGKRKRRVYHGLHTHTHPPQLTCVATGCSETPRRSSEASSAT